MKNILTILFCLLICWMSASGVFAKGYKQDTHKVQKKLSALGYAPGPADGMMGNKTRKAIKKFQKSRGLKATGTLDSHTLNLLLNRTSNADRPTGKNNTPDKNKPHKQDPRSKVSKKQGQQKHSADQGRKDNENRKKEAPMKHKP
ncbi:peptidoglycan-binding domain-containing protein [Desulfobacter hydrogenophilus]|nr:peptidoglycan-binding domain-containing protein [Desulfobacter hydrogenophilus]NDY72203.1 peptidoglycan-binding protein [Desulfobacter hydrogenophilus]